MSRSGWNWLNAVRRTLARSFSSFAPPRRFTRRREVERGAHVEILEERVQLSE